MIDTIGYVLGFIVAASLFHIMFWQPKGGDGGKRG
jgi:hypothetical protein